MDCEERRCHERFRIELRAVLSAETPWQGRAVSSIVTRDISTSGAFLRTSARYPVGLAVEIELTITLRDAERFSLGGSACVELKGSIIRAEPNGVAVTFQNGYQMRQSAQPSGWAGPP